MDCYREGIVKPFITQILGFGKERIKVSVFQVEGRRNNRAKLLHINFTVRLRSSTVARVEP